jgi:hypothetical protein
MIVDEEYNIYAYVNMFLLRFGVISTRLIPISYVDDETSLLMLYLRHVFELPTNMLNFIRTVVNFNLILLALAYALIVFKVLRPIADKFRYIDRYYFIDLFDSLKLNMFSFIGKLFFECLIIVYLVFNFFILSIPTLINNGLANKVVLFETPELLNGLSALKFYLYDYTGLFLLISTIVLLVALIGVAIITRNKK